MIFPTLGVSSLAVQRFVAKVGLENTPSLTLFKKLGYTEVRNSLKILLLLPIIIIISSSSSLFGGGSVVVVIITIIIILSPLGPPPKCSGHVQPLEALTSFQLS